MRFMMNGSYYQHAQMLSFIGSEKRASGSGPPNMPCASGPGSLTTHLFLREARSENHGVLTWRVTRVFPTFVHVSSRYTVRFRHLRLSLCR